MATLARLQNQANADGLLFSACAAFAIAGSKRGRTRPHERGHDMSNGVVFRSVLRGALAFAPLAVLAQMGPAQSFSASTVPSGMQGPAASSSAQDSGLYQDGMRAITDGRWPDAEAIFTKVATQHACTSMGRSTGRHTLRTSKGKGMLHSEPARNCAANFPPATGSMSAGRWRSRFRRRLGNPLNPKCGAMMI